MDSQGKHGDRYYLVMTHIAIENGPFIDSDDFPIKTSIYGGFSMAMSNNQMVAVWGQANFLNGQNQRPKAIGT